MRGERLSSASVRLESDSPLAELADQPEQIVLLNGQSVFESVFSRKFGPQVADLSRQLLAIRSQVDDSSLQGFRFVVVPANHKCLALV